MAVVARVVAVALLGGLAVGCSVTPRVVRAYAGDPFPRAEVAVVRGWNTAFGYPGGMHVSFERVDGVGVVGGISPMMTEEVDMLPGTHVIAVSSSTSSTRSIDDVLVEIDAQAGKLYEIRAIHESSGGFSLGGTWRAWAIEVDREDW